MNAPRREPRGAPPRGFSLVELAVVIALVAILAAVAFTHLGRARQDTVNARIESVAGALQAAVADFHANWRLHGQRRIDVPGWGDGTLDANAGGFPVGARRDADTVGSDADCEDVWRGLLLGGPSVAAAGADGLHSRFADRAPSLAVSGIEFLAGQDDGIDHATVHLPDTPAGEICQFVWLRDQPIRPGSPKRTIFYDSRTGAVFVDPDRAF